MKLSLFNLVTVLLIILPYIFALPKFNIRRSNNLKPQYKELKPEDLAKLNKNDSNLFIASDYEYNDSSYKEKFLAIERKIRESKVSLKVFILNKIPKEYFDEKLNRMNIEKYTNELASLIYKNKTLEKNSVTLVISVLDRQIRVKLGIEVKKVLKYAVLKDILKDAKSYLRSNKVNEGIQHLLQSMNMVLRTGKYLNENLMSDMIFIGIFCVFFSFGLLSFCMRLCCGFSVVSKVSVDSKGLSILNKLKVLVANHENLSPTNFIDKACVICLEDMSKGNEEVVTLKCKHKLHTKCHEEWYKIRKHCPICSNLKRNLARMSDEAFFTRLFIIQSDYHAPLEGFEYTIREKTLTWVKNPTITTSQIEFDFSSPLGDYDFFNLLTLLSCSRLNKKK